MLKDLPNEQWKPVQFDFEFSNDYRLEVSNYGRLKTYNKINKGQLLQGSTIKGYKIVRLKFYEKREANTDLRFRRMQEQINKLKKQIKSGKLPAGVSTKKEASGLSQPMLDLQQLLESLQKNLKKDMEKDVKKRVIHYHSLVHRLVAEYFCTKPSPEHTLVAHLDYNKQNNYYKNLSWMTPDENITHQQTSPNVISSRAQRKVGQTYNPNSKVNKLTITKVMLLKKLLNEGKPIKTLVKQFKITDTQIMRIKRGENWGYVEAAH